MPQTTSSTSRPTFFGSGSRRDARIEAANAYAARLRAVTETRDTELRRRLELIAKMLPVLAASLPVLGATVRLTAFTLDYGIPPFLAFAAPVPEGLSVLLFWA